MCARLGCRLGQLVCQGFPNIACAKSLERGKKDELTVQVCCIFRSCKQLGLTVQTYVQTHFDGWVVGSSCNRCVEFHLKFEQSVSEPEWSASADLHLWWQIGMKADVSMPKTICQFIEGTHEGTHPNAVFRRLLDLYKT